MAHLIDKDALVAEIERLKSIYNDDENIYYIAKYNILIDILSFLDTLEVKEVNLDNAIERYIEQHKSELNGYFDIRRIARYFYSLGLNVFKDNTNIKT